MSISSKLIELSKSDIYPFHMPGHKRRLAPCKGLEAAYDMDITEVDGFDVLQEASGILKDAQEKAAKLYDVDKSFFLINSTTAGILATVCALCKEGDTVIMARNCHKAVYNAVMLSGANVHYIYPKQEAFFEINSGINPGDIEDLLRSDNISGNVLVIITSPTYEGLVSDIAAIKAVCEKYGATLFVDAAHGAHLHFSEDFPVSAIDAGADIEVISLHKTLPSPTQTALLNVRGSVREIDRIHKFLGAFQTSSPSYLLMAGIEACIDYLEENARDDFEKYSKKLDEFYNFAKSLNNLGVLTKDSLVREESFDFDKGKILIRDKSGRYSGKELYDILLNTYKLQPEMAAGDYVLLMTSIADDKKGFDRLEEALEAIDRAISNEEAPVRIRNVFTKLIDRFVGRRIKKSLFKASFEPKEYIKEEVFPEIISKVKAKEVLFEENKEFVELELSEGRISAANVSLYPPGIPVINYGEVITGQMIDTLLSARENGLNITGLKENAEIEVLWEK